MQGKLYVDLGALLLKLLANASISSIQCFDGASRSWLADASSLSTALLGLACAVHSTHPAGSTQASSQGLLLLLLSNLPRKASLESGGLRTAQPEGYELPLTPHRSGARHLAGTSTSQDGSSSRRGRAICRVLSVSLHHRTGAIHHLQAVQPVRRQAGCQALGQGECVLQLWHDAGNEDQA